MPVTPGGLGCLAFTPCWTLATLVRGLLWSLVCPHPARSSPRGPQPQPLDWSPSLLFITSTLLRATRTILGKWNQGDGGLLAPASQSLPIDLAWHSQPLRGLQASSLPHLFSFHSPSPALHSASVDSLLFLSHPSKFSSLDLSGNSLPCGFHNNYAISSLLL